VGLFLTGLQYVVKGAEMLFPNDSTSSRSVKPGGR